MVKRTGTFLLALALCVTGMAHATVSAQLSETRIGELETVRLTIRASETRQTQTLDLSALETDFHVMGTNTSSQYRYRNGREQSWVDYQITLQPKRTGTLRVPPIAVGRALTPPLTLQVNPLAERTRQTIEELVFFESSVSTEAVYVQAQVLLTRKLFYSQGVQLYSDLPGAPEIPDAVVLTLGETKSGTVQRGERVYGVVEQNYAIYPEASGTLEIPSIAVTASVRLRENGRLARKGVRVETETIDVRVKPVPAGFPAGATWLPAENVQILQVIDESRADVGDSLTHELLIHVDGNIGTMAPPIELGLNEREFRVYPEAPVIKDDTNGDTVRGSRLQTSAVVPQRPGNLTLPALRLPWWDTRSDELRFAEVPSLNLAIAGQPIVQNLPPGPASAAQDAPQGDATPGLPTIDIAQLEGYAQGLWWLMALALGAVTIVWARRNDWWRSDAQRARSAETAALARARAHLDRVLAEDDFSAIYPAVTDVACRLWQLPVHEAVPRLRAQDAEIAIALDRLQAHRYRQDSDGTNPDVSALRRVLSLTPTRAVQAPKHDELPPLYVS